MKKTAFFLTFIFMSFILNAQEDIAITLKVTGQVMVRTLPAPVTVIRSTSRET